MLHDLWIQIEFTCFNVVEFFFLWKKSTQNRTQLPSDFGELFGIDQKVTIRTIINNHIWEAS